MYILKRYIGKTKEERQLEMLKDRHLFIGASDVGKILNLSKYGCATSVYRQKKGLIPPLDPNSWQLQRGHYLEPLVLKKFKENNPELNVIAGDEFSYISKEYDFMRCNPDGIITYKDGEQIGLEIKNISPYNKDKWDSGSVPDEYYLQCQYSMFITGFKRWILSVAFDCEPIEYFVDRDDELIDDTIIPECIDFWESYYLKNIEPSVPEEYYNKETLKQLYSNVNKSEDHIKLPILMIEVLRNIEAVKLKIKELETIQEKDECLIKSMLGESQLGKIESDDASADIKWTACDSKPKFSEKLLKQNFPDIYKEIYSKCSETSKPSRRFSFKINNK